MAVKIVTDSVADLPPTIAEDLGITVIPLILRFGEEEFKDGIDISNEEFYQKLQDCKDFPVTSTPPPGAFAEAYNRLSDETDEILVILLSSRLSGTCDVALNGRDLVKKECRIEVLDSETATMTEGFIVMKAAEAAREGAPLDECIRIAEAAKKRVDFLSTFDTLEYLHRGGRIGAAQAFMGSVLKINPLITLKDGIVAPAGRTRSRAKAVDKLCDFVGGYSSIDYIAVEHTACPEEAAQLTDRLQAMLPGQTIYVSKMTPVIGVHTGPGLLLVAVMGNKENE